MLAYRPFVAYLICLGLGMLQAGAAQAGVFQVSPVKLTLAPGAKSQILTLHNRSAVPLRFHVSAFAWQQSRAGAIQLQPTKDIVVFPTMLKIAPGSRRIIRVGTTAPFGKLEKTYRIFVAELPTLERSGKTAKNAVQVLTRMGIPIFLRAAKPRVKARIEQLAVQKGHVSLRVRNVGTAHFRIGEVRLVGRAKDGRVSFDRILKGWYVLGGGVRDYDLALPSGVCATLSALEVELTAGTAKAQAAIAVRTADCAR